jgi:hypothetical protein
MDGGYPASKVGRYVVPIPRVSIACAFVVMVIGDVMSWYNECGNDSQWRTFTLTVWRPVGLMELEEPCSGY